MYTKFHKEARLPVQITSGKYRAARFESSDEFKDVVFKTFELDDRKCYSFSGKSYYSVLSKNCCTVEL